MESLCLDFVNTRWYLTHKIKKEILADPALLKEFLEERQLHSDIPPTQETTAGLLELRAFLAELLEEYTRTGSITLEAITRINHYLAASVCRRVMEKRESGLGIAVRPISFDWNWIMAEVAASCAALIEHGDGSRIKLCENPDCRWFFYDETKSRTKRWCDDKCASLMKVRRFRAKGKEKASIAVADGSQ